MIDLVKTQVGVDKRVENYLICTRHDNEETFVYRDFPTFQKIDSDVSVSFVLNLRHVYQC